MCPRTLLKKIFTNEVVRSGWESNPVLSPARNSISETPWLSVILCYPLHYRCDVVGCVHSDYAQTSLNSSWLQLRAKLNGSVLRTITSRRMSAGDGIQPPSPKRMQTFQNGGSGSTRISTSDSRFSSSNLQVTLELVGLNSASPTPSIFCFSNLRAITRHSKRDSSLLSQSRSTR
jgi:hypothetical protein